MSDLEKLADRIQQHRTRDKRMARATLRPAAAGGQGSVGGYAPGDRVFDQVSGLEGTVEHGTRANIVRAAPKQ